jgi:membrane protease YdiL (CAAX protease family)
MQHLGGDASDLYVLIGAALYLAVVAVLSRKRLAELLPQRFFKDTWLDSDRRAQEANASRAAAAGQPRVDWRPLSTYVAAALVLTAQKYLGDPAVFRWVLAQTSGAGPAGAIRVTPLRDATAAGGMSWLTDPHWAPLANITYWDAWQVFGFFAVPAVIIWMRGERLRDYGMRARAFFQHAWIYAFMLGLVIPVVWLASGTQQFSNYYPIYRLAGRSWFDLLFWESVYSLQFLSLELFFRGFLVLGLEDRLGSAVVAAAVVPYCMIHYGKPLPEVCGAIVAGLVLGTLALKTRSILAGAMIHVTVAISMDLSALLRTSGLPTHWMA